MNCLRSAVTQSLKMRRGIGMGFSAMLLKHAIDASEPWPASCRLPIVRSLVVVVRVSGGGGGGVSAMVM